MKLLTAPEVATILGVDKTTVRKNAQLGKLGFRALRIGSRWKFLESDVYNFINGETKTDEN